LRWFASLALAGALHATDHVQYVPRQWVSGHLRCVGSETMDILLARWAEAFSRIHPAWTLEVDGKGSRVAMRALERSGADLAALSRVPSGADFPRSGLPKSQGRFLVLVGWDTLRFRWRLGAHPDTSEIRPAYLGRETKLRPIGRNLSSGTRDEVRSAIGGTREFGSGVRSLPSPSQVAQAVASDPLSVGYGSSGWSLSRLERSSDAIQVRPLVLAFPAGPMRPAVSEFLSFVLSRQGQKLVADDGFRPLNPDSAAAWRASLGL
jgi:phosphate transport system substrate-binding protein